MTPSSHRGRALGVAIVEVAARDEAAEEDEEEDEEHDEHAERLRWCGSGRGSVAGGALVRRVGDSRERRVEAVGETKHTSPPPSLRSAAPRSHCFWNAHPHRTAEPSPHRRTATHREEVGEREGAREAHDRVERARLSR